MKPAIDNSHSTSWRWVLALLLGTPLFLAWVLRAWLGVPEEKQSAQAVFQRLGLKPVPLSEHHSLQYGNIFFCRLALSVEGEQAFYSQLSGFVSKEGTPQKPLSLKLERPWWDIDSKLNGTTRTREGVTLWSPAGHSRLIYATVEGTETPAGGNGQGG